MTPERRDLLGAAVGAGGLNGDDSLRGVIRQTDGEAEGLRCRLGPVDLLEVEGHVFGEVGRGHLFADRGHELPPEQALDVVERRLELLRGNGHVVSEGDEPRLDTRDSLGGHIRREALGQRRQPFRQRSTLFLHQRIEVGGTEGARTRTEGVQRGHDGGATVAELHAAHDCPWDRRALGHDLGRDLALLLAARWGCVGLGREDRHHRMRQLLPNLGIVERGLGVAFGITMAVGLGYLNTPIEHGAPDALAPAVQLLAKAQHGLDFRAAPRGTALVLGTVDAEGHLQALGSRPSEEPGHVHVDGRIAHCR